MRREDDVGGRARVTTDEEHTVSISNFVRLNNFLWCHLGLWGPDSLNLLNPVAIRRR